jgi:hypothetical protein
MKIEVAPQINLDSIRELDANKRYFLSSTTGQIKEASWWMRFKCALGFSSALSKVSNLVDAVKTTLLENAGKSSDAALEADIKAINVGDDIKGRVLQDLATRFRAANSTAMMRKEAEAAARQQAALGFMFVNQRNHLCGRDQDIIPIFQHAFKAVVEGDLPTRQDGNGRPVLDKTALDNRLNAVREEVTRLLLDIGNDTRLGQPAIDRHYARHIIATLFAEDGTRSENALSDLQTPDEAFAAHLFNLDDHYKHTNASSVHDELVAQKRDPVAYAKHIRELCGGDKDLEDIVEYGLRAICESGQNELRTEEAVAAKIAGIRENLAEAREVDRRFPGFYADVVDTLYELNGVAFPRGAIARMAEAAGRADFSKLAKLNSFSGPGAIIEAVEQLREATYRLGNAGEVFPQRRGELMPNGPEEFVCRRIVQAVAMAKAGPAARARIANAVHGTACREAAYILEMRQTESRSPVLFPDGDVRKHRDRYFSGAIQVLDDLNMIIQGPCDEEAAIDTTGITVEQVQQHIDRDVDTLFDTQVANAMARERND